VAAFGVALVATAVPAHAVSPTSPVAARSAAAPAGARALPAAVVPPGRYAIGDSVMLGSKKLLSARGITVNATVSRQFSQAVPILAALRAAHRLPRNVIVHLGTNGIVKVSDCRAIVDGAGTGRRVFLVTVHGARSWIPSANAHLRTCAKAYAGSRVIVIDWNKAATGHGSWFGSDGIHPNSTGRVHYVALITAYVSRYGI
jgi:lysophospholipase L1-like esterase